MRDTILRIVRTIVPDPVLVSLREKRMQKELDEWEKRGCPAPPPHIIKQRAIASYHEKYGHNVLVETGTFLGTMVEAQKRRFSKVYSIELSPELFRKAKDRFRNDKNVQIVQGDSAKVLSTVLKEINEPAVFWLDGHYSAGETAIGDKDCPIYEEFDAIFNAGNHNHIFLIDDARCFGTTSDYPTIEALTAYIKNKDPRYNVEVKDDIIRYVIQ